MRLCRQEKGMAGLLWGSRTRGFADDHQTGERPRRAWGPIRQSYALFVQHDRWRWVLLIGLAVIVAGLEAIGASLIYMLVGLLGESDSGVELPLIGDVSDFIPDVTDQEMLLGTAIAIGLFFVLRGALQVIQTYQQQTVAHNAGARLSAQLVQGYLKMPYAYHLRHESSEFLRNAVSSVQQAVIAVVLPAARFVAEIVLVLGLALVLFTAAPIASLIVFAVLGPATYGILRIVKSRVKRYGRAAVDSAQETLRILQQGLHGIRDVRLLGREQFFIARFRRQRRKDARARALQATFDKMTSVTVELLLVLFIVGFLVVTVTAVGAAAESLPVLGLFAYVGLRLKPSVQKIIAAANSLRFATPALSDLHHDFEEAATRPIIDDGPSSKRPRTPIPTLTESIRLVDVAFRYEEAEHSALDQVTLEIRAGESIGICGPTGGGKSTLVDIVVGLLEPTSGRVLVDGVDIHDDIRNWYNQLGLVSQNIYLFDDTLRRNIALGVSRQEIDESALWDAVEMAQLNDLVTNLPNGLDTRVGEHGALLSGGQRQRVAIARALYRDPSVLVLDEGTSALDNQTEREVMQSLQGLRLTKTLIIVAHRLSTIEKCDRVMFVDQGRVAGVGSYDELYVENAAFRLMAG